MQAAGVSPGWLYTAVAAAAVALGTLLWWANRPERATAEAAPAEVAPAALLAATFRDAAGAPHALGEFQGKILVINFWATWCVPCREEMPAFSRLDERWKAQGVQFVGLAQDDPAKVERFAREAAVRYPLWLGGEEVGELSRRLGNRLGVLPHTVIVDRSGRVIDARIGPYAERDLEAKLRQTSSNGS